LSYANSILLQEILLKSCAVLLLLLQRFLTNLTNIFMKKLSYFVAMIATTMVDEEEKHLYEKKHHNGQYSH
jgi:hypothetical protein